jgi:putative transposase
MQAALGIFCKRTTTSPPVLKDTTRVLNRSDSLPRHHSWHVEHGSDGLGPGGGRQANRLPFQLEALIVQLRKEHPSWGAPKIREKIKRQRLGIALPAISTVHAVLDRHGLVTRGRRRQHFKAEGTSLSRPDNPNDLWCADYKGEFMLADRRYCYPLTITDFASRYLLCCEALETTKERYAFTVFERTFKDFGLPRAIRSDNGVPFASSCAFFGLSKLSVWWLRLGINMRYPAELYAPSPRPYTGLQELHYPFHDMTITVTQCGRLCFGGRKINLSGVFAGQNVGVREVADHIWLISFMHYDLGFFDDQCTRVECAPNPFSANVSAMSPV